MNQGDFFFCKQIMKIPPKDNPNKMFQTFSAQKGVNLIGILLGQVKPDQDPPTQGNCMALLAAIGIVGFDDVNEALGAEAVEKLMNHVDLKYNGPRPPPTFPAPGKLEVVK